MVRIANNQPCVVSRTLNLIDGKWKILIMYNLLQASPAPVRYSSLRKSIGDVTEKMLTAQLRALEQDRLISRQVYAEVPPRVEYSLTTLGHSIRPVLDTMRVWGEEHAV